MLVIGLVIGLADGLTGGRVLGLAFGLTSGLVLGLAGGLALGLLTAAFEVFVDSQVDRLSVKQIDVIDTPNQGLHRSAQNALVWGLVGCLVLGPAGALVAALVLGGLTGGLGGGLASCLSAALHIGPTFGLGPGLIFGMEAGGAACIKHLALRLLLVRNGSIPWSYVTFLDFAADRILLRKVGGGYVFLHRMLLEHFAARYVEPSGKGTDSTKPSAIN